MNSIGPNSLLILAAHYTYTQTRRQLTQRWARVLFVTRTRPDPTQVYSDAMLYATCRKFSTDACSCKVIKHEIDLSVTDETRPRQLSDLMLLVSSVVVSGGQQLV